MKRYIIKAYIPAEVDPESETYYESEEEALNERENLGEMQPENIYVVEEAENEEEEELGYGKCPDCIWSEDTFGCNVPKDSEECRRNRKEIQK